MVRHSLQPHRASPALAIEGVSCRVWFQGAALWSVAYEVNDPAGALVVPEPKAPNRTDELWKRTCFELFVRRAGAEAYYEFNLSPSGQWAAYRLDRYRGGMKDLAVVAPRIQSHWSAKGHFTLEAQLDLSALEGPGPWSASLSAVIEEANGAKSYWALAHGSDKPDFHHPDSFVLELA